jgi:hypothetical protein
MVQVEMDAIVKDRVVKDRLRVIEQGPSGGQAKS